MNSQQPCPFFEPDQLLRIDEAAAFLKCHTCTIRRWIDNGHLPAYRRGRLIRVRLFDLMQTLAPPGKQELTEPPYSISAHNPRTCVTPSSKLD